VILIAQEDALELSILTHLEHVVSQMKQIVKKDVLA